MVGHLRVVFTMNCVKKVMPKFCPVFLKSNLFCRVRWMMNQCCNKKTLLTTNTSVKSCLSVVLFLFISELVIKLLIDANNTLKEEEKEAIKEMLTQLVQTCDDQSRDLKCLKSFTNNLIEIYKVLDPAVCKGSIVVSLRCPTLESLEHLWSDYCSGDLDKLAERYLVTDDMKKRLKLETSYLKITIDEKNYLNCKKAFIGLPDTCSGEYKQNSWEVEVNLSLSVSRMYNGGECASGAWEEVQ